VTSTDLLSSAVVGAVAGAAASLLNGWLQRRSALEVARVSLVMPMREAWIGQLRDKLASFLAACTEAIRVEQAGGEKTMEIVSIRYGIELMLNPKEADHDALEEALNHLAALAVRRPKDVGGFTQASSALRTLARRILKVEWDRVQAKAGK
jgi:hypothetical protein